MVAKTHSSCAKANTVPGIPLAFVVLCVGYYEQHGSIAKEGERMSLTIVTTGEERLASTALKRLIRDGCQSGGAVVMVPGFAEVLEVQKDLADEGIGLGAEVCTPDSWMRDRWDVWGDGRRVVNGPVRTLLVAECLRERAKDSEFELSQTPGTVRLLGSLAQRALPWLGEALRNRGDRLTPAERCAVSLLGAYEGLLKKRGFIEGAECAYLLPESLAQAGALPNRVVLVGFDDFSRATRELTCGLARIAEVILVVRTAKTLYCEQALLVASLLRKDAESRGLEVSYVREEAEKPAERDAELDSLLRVLFRKGAKPLEPTGSVRQSLPSGPLAEAELVAREVAGLARENARDVVVVVSDVRRAWRELAPKLLAHNLTVRAQMSVSPLDTEPGRAFAGYVRTVAQLTELSATWPPPLETDDGEYARVGSMDWWPPAELVDFLLSGISHVAPAKARSLDIAWRGNRLLSPADVLAQLQSAKVTSDAVERATRELLRGRIGSAASKLLAPFVAAGAGAPVGHGRHTSLVHEEATAALGAYLSVAGTLKELGLSADPEIGSSVSLSELAQAAEIALGSTRIVLRAEAQAGHERARVLLVGRGAAASLAPASFDAAVLCGLTSTGFAVPSAEGELEGILADLEIEEEQDGIATQRTLFSRLCSLPTKRLLLERPLFDVDAKETYPAVMLTELLSCYGQKLPKSQLSEDHARANASAIGAAPPKIEEEAVALAGNVDKGLRRLVIVPQEGQAELPDGLPVLSASQIESYLECPLKWFSLRRLRLGNNDAGFGPLEMGTFAHRVLELTFAQLFAEGKAVLDVRDVDAMAYAHAVLDDQFRTHVEHQHMRVGNRMAYQALIPHTSREESDLERLHRDLSSTLEYVGARLQGYEPRAFEWGFGRGSRAQEQDGLPMLAEATYAGVRVTGTVDRIDINSQGQAVIIDYKHKGPTGFFAEYAAFSGKDDQEDEFVLPRRIQSLLYAQVVRKAFPDLRVVGALYLGTRGTHELSGAVDEAQADPIFGDALGPRRARQVVVERSQSFGQESETGMNALLDATEESIARKVDRLREGHIEAEPCDAKACLFCPVSNCERRLQ